MPLTKKRQIVAVTARSASGPGWANSPVWVVWRDEYGQLHEDCLQPNEQSIEIHTLYRVCAAAAAALEAAVVRQNPNYQRAG